MAQHNNIHIGDVFGRLTIITEPYKIGKRWYVNCKCICGKIKEKIRVDGIMYGRTKSCGCLSKEKWREIGKKWKSYNEYEFSDNCGIGYTNNVNQYGENYFYFDKEDYELIKDYCWCFDKDGYLFSMFNQKNVKMHRLIMNCPDNMEVDHRYYTIDGKSTKNDNRKDNLRICTHKENCRNRINKNTGIIETREGFAVYKKSKFLGIYNTYEKAYFIKQLNNSDAITVER